MAEELEVPYPKAVRDFPTIRQSLLAQFDSCALWTKLDLDYRDGWSGHPQARGTIFHRMAAKSLQQMADMEEKMIAPGDALAILRECLRQHDVVPEDVVTIPFSQIKDLRWVTIKWANENIFDVEHLASVEDRLNTPIEYESPMGMVRRVLTGQLDALFIPEPDHAIVVDWKDAQPLDAKILTPAGWTTMGQLNAGDLVIGSDGKPTEVLGVHPKGERLVYEVEFTDGSKTRCCDHHWWKVRRSGCNWQIKRLSELIGHERQGTGYWQVPAPKPVEFDRQDELPLDPYLLGVLLGDGDFPSEASVGLTTADDEIVEAVRAALPEGMTTQHAARYNWRLTADSRAERNPLRKALVSLGLMGCKAADKFVPPNYLFGDPAQRFDLLCGLMDTDGTIDKDGRMSFCSASAEMAEQVQFLVRSLGGFATRKVWPRPGHHDTNVVYFRMDRAPFRLARKKGRWRKPTKGMTRGIRAIRPLTVEPVQCIEVAAEDSLYATDDLILTHNTWALPRESEVSERGYFQQRFYGMLVMTRYPAIQRVTLRETYVRLKDAVTEAAPVREATVFRSELEDIRDEMAALAERFDRAVEHGKWPLKEGEKPELWTPAPGSHCAWCPRPTACPIFPDARVQGAIESDEQAKLWAGQSIVAKAAQKQRDEALRAWANVHGAIPVRNAKDSSRVLGYREQKRTSRPKAEEVERLVREQGEYADVQSLYKTTTVTRFDQHSPTEGESVPDAPEDLPLVEALEQSLAEQKAQSADTPKEP